MKSIVPLQNSSVSQLKIVKNETEKAEQIQTPYLNAILSATTSLTNAKKSIQMVSPDLSAALRYIKESALIRK